MEKPIIKKGVPSLDKSTEESRIVIRLGIKQAQLFRTARDKGANFSIEVDRNDYLYINWL